MRQLQNAITQRAMLAAAQNMSREHGLIESYDPNTHSVKVTRQPSGKLTGWLPLSTPAIGNGWGVAFGPQIGDQVVIDYLGGDVEAGVVTGFIYSDQDRPPGVPAGELWVMHSSGSLLKFHNDGTVEITAASTMTYTATEHHFVGPVQMDSTLNVTDTLSGEGGMAISGDNGSGKTLSIDGDLNTNGTITNNGHDIGSTHKHINSGGSGLGGVPQ